MNINIKEKKASLREHAQRTRNLFNNLDAQQQQNLCRNFFDNVEILGEDCVVASYWPVGRELDTSILMEELLKRDIRVALPVVEEGTRILKFAQWNIDMPMRIGHYNIPCPDPEGNIVWLEPDIFLVPTLAFDRKGYRLGYGGGYYDTTLAKYRELKDIVAVGLAYAEQACLFPLPVENHDQRMDWIITEQNANFFRVLF